MKKIEVKISAIASSKSNEKNYILLLKEQNGKKCLSVNIGEQEAKAMATFLSNTKVTLPQTHDLFKNTLEILKSNITEAVIYDVTDGLYLSHLKVESKEKELFEVNARLSDAVSLCIRMNRPIYVSEKVMKQVGTILSQDDTNSYNLLEDYSVSELEKLLQEVLSVEDFKKAARIRDLIKKKTSG